MRFYFRSHFRQVFELPVNIASDDSEFDYEANAPRFFWKYIENQQVNYKFKLLDKGYG